MTVISFTGTRDGMTTSQAARVGLLLFKAFEPGDEFHHGDCIGADDEAARIAKGIGYLVVAHPGSLEHARAHSPANDLELEPKHPLDRNDDLVLVATTHLIAAPKETREVLRSGTWATIRRGRKRGLVVPIVGPAGSLFT
jgi:hypothetical protein